MSHFTERAIKWMDIAKKSPKHIICGTGHRPDKLKISYSIKDLYRLSEFIQTGILSKFKPDCVISGGALGFDLALAIATQNLGISLVMALPFKNYYQKWSNDYISLLNRICSKQNTYQLYICDNEIPVVKRLMLRNEWMVDASKEVVALYDEKERKSGTGACVNYANSNNIKVYNFFNDWSEYNLRIV